MKTSKKIVILLIIILVLIAVSFIYKWLDENRLFIGGGSTYTGLHPFRLILSSMRVTTYDGSFQGVFINTLNESVTITDINLTNIECSYGDRSMLKKIECKLFHRSNPSCIDNYGVEVDGRIFDTLPIQIRANEEFTLKIVDCKAIKNTKIGERCWIDLFVDYQIRNKTSSTRGRIGTYYK